MPDTLLQDPELVLTDARRPEHHGESISKLATTWVSVGTGTNVYALAAAMDTTPGLLAVGVRG